MNLPMNQLAITLIGLSALFFLGHALRGFFLKTKIPDLLFLIFVGWLLGPALGILNPDDLGQFGHILTTIALVVILYEAGLELKAKQLVQSSLPALGLSILSFSLVAAAAFGLLHYAFNFAPQTSLLIGIGIGSISSAVVIPMVRILDMTKSSRTILSLESALTDVLTVVVFLVVLDAVKNNDINVGTIIAGIGPDTLKAVLLGLFGGFLWAVLRKQAREITDASFAGESWALLWYGIVELMHLNGAMAVLALGFMLSNLDLLPEWAKPFCVRRPVDKERLALLKEINLLLSTFFFVYLGLLINVNDPRTFYIALALVLTIFLTRWVAVHIILRKRKFTKSDALITVCMGPRGLACAVLATLPVQAGIADAETIQQTMFAVIPSSILFTAIFVVMTEKPSPRSFFIRFFPGYKGT